MKFALNKLVRRQTDSSRFSYFDGTDSDLLLLVEQNFPLREKSPYSDEVFTVPLPVVLNNKCLFYSAIVPINNRNLLRTAFVSCRENSGCGQDTESRISVSVYNNKVAGKYAEVVLYSKKLLELRGKNSSDADFEIVSINVSPQTFKSPMHPYDLLRAYITNPEFFEKQTSMKDIMQSIDFWSKHAMFRDSNKVSLLESADPEVISLLMKKQRNEAIKYLTNKGVSNMANIVAEIKNLENLLSEKGLV